MNPNSDQPLPIEQHRLAIIGFPYDHNSSFMQGPAEAPPAIRSALRSDSSNLWTEAGIDLGRPGLLYDAGDRKVAQESNPFDDITTAISELLHRQLRPIILGGDHSITYPSVRAISATWKDLTILHFDAHPDLYDHFEGNRESHACPFARIMEAGLAKRLVQVGIRTMNGHQREQAETFGVEVIEMRHWRDDITLKIDSPLYISFDMDALDPAFAPGVSHHEPGGFSTRQVINAIQALQAEIVGADIVELNPSRDPLSYTAMAAAKILKEIAAKMLG